ncbi:MAG: DUF1501 domain-containing protein [Armatimonadetes bacterium]|nr:DUF1501 domain-containing protein [Armatimonadota bacterium]MDE2207204.1 DUF1501 domain-containing protein [Armatimonadota bacterium]
MFDIELGRHIDCDGVSRRDFLRVGAISAFGLTLPAVLQAGASAAPGPGKSARDTACILLWMGGGPSHMDTFDPKPDAPVQYRGAFGAINTNVKGIQITEHLPKLAQQADKFSILRSVTSNDGNHETATEYLLSGYPFSPAIDYPAYGSVIAREKGSQQDLPPYVLFGGLPFNHGGAGYIGGQYNPFMINGDPANKYFKVENITPPSGVDQARMDRRHSLAMALDDWQRNKETAAPAVRTMDVFDEKAYALITSPAAKKAFNLQAESPDLRAKYGHTQFGQSCLLARRLVESGVRCVTVNYGGWDTHQNNFESLKNGLLPTLDMGYSALLQDLHDRGMLDSTVVLWMGEFGRTPQVNGAAGRDHWPGVLSVCLGGGGARTGQVVGASSKLGETPDVRPIRVEDVAATIYKLMGVDFQKQYMSPQQRPIAINYGGTPISELC